MNRLNSAIELNNHGIASMMEKAESSHEEAITYFMESLVTLQELLGMCDASSSPSVSSSASPSTSPSTPSQDAGVSNDAVTSDSDGSISAANAMATASHEELPAISIDVVSLPADPNTHSTQLRKVLAFDSDLLRQHQQKGLSATDEDDVDALRLDVLQVFSACVIFNISLWYHMQSQKTNTRYTDTEIGQCQEKARLLYEKACLCLPQQNGYPAYAMMLRVLSIHNLGVLYRELGCFDKSRDCVLVARDLVLSTGSVIPSMLDVDGNTFLQTTAVFLSATVLGDDLALHAAAAA